MSTHPPLHEDILPGAAGLIGMVNMRPVAIVLGVGIVVLLVLLLRAASTRFGEKPRDNEPPSGE